jgi:hypothetical protein
MCARASGFNTTVPLPILHVECEIGLITFRTDGLGVEVWSLGLHVLPIWPLDFYSWGYMKEKFYAMDVLDRDDIINRTGVAAADIVPSQLVSVRGSIRRRCEACVPAEGYTWNICRDYAQCIQCAEKSAPHEQKSALKEALWSDDWKMLRRAEFAFFLSFVANKEMIWHYIEMNCFHSVKVNSHNNKSNIYVKTSKLRNGGES